MERFEVVTQSGSSGIWNEQAATELLAAATTTFEGIDSAEEAAASSALYAPLLREAATEPARSFVSWTCS